MSHLIRCVRDDGARILAIAGVVALLFGLAIWLPALFGEPALAPLFTSVAMVGAIVAASHVMRRLLFPRLDLQTIAQRAMEEPTGAAVVFLGICLVLAVIIHANMSMLR